MYNRSALVLFAVLVTAALLYTGKTGFTQEENTAQKKESRVSENVESDPYDDGTAGSGTGKAPKEKPVVHYVINASLIPVEWKIDGKAKITFVNRTGHSTDRLLFQLYPNAYSNSASLGAAGIPVSREEVVKNGASGLGYMNILDVRTEDGSPFPKPPSIEGTLMEVYLPAPLEPGAEVAVEITFAVKLPDRTLGPIGFKGRHADAAQWYPKIGLLTDDGWKLQRPELPQYFASPFGNCDVTLSIPSNFVLDAAGKLVESHEENSTLKKRYEAMNVLDFAWTADPLYVPEKNIYKGVEIVVLAQPFMQGKVPGLISTAKKCIDWFEESVLPYPYERLVISTTPYGEGCSTGRPMLLSVPQNFPTTCMFLVEETLNPEGDLIREMCGHLFRCLVPGRDRPASELNDGLSFHMQLEMMRTCFDPEKPSRALGHLEHKILSRLLDKGFGLYAMDENRPSPDMCPLSACSMPRFLNLTSFMGFMDSPFPQPRGSTLLGYRLPDMRRPGFIPELHADIKNEHFRSRNALMNADPEANRHLPHGGIPASGVVLALKTLENRIGPDKMKQLFKAYAGSHIFSHTTVDDFLLNVMEVAGRENAEMMDLLLHNNGVLDYSIDSATCRKVVEPKGFVTKTSRPDGIKENFEPIEDSSGQMFNRARWEDIIWFGNDEEEARPETDTVDEPIHTYQWQVVVGNRGDVTLPVTILLKFDGKIAEEREWNGKGGVLCLGGEGPSRLISAEVDPGGVYASDINRLNNKRSVRFKDKETLFLAGWSHFWLQNYLNGWAFFN